MFSSANASLLERVIKGKRNNRNEQQPADMPHAILRVTNMSGIIVREFHLSFPEDLQRRFMSMFSGIGLKPSMNPGGHVTFEGEFFFPSLRDVRRMCAEWKLIIR